MFPLLSCPFFLIMPPNIDCERNERNIMGLGNLDRTRVEGQLRLNGGAQGVRAANTGWRPKKSDRDFFGRSFFLHLIISLSLSPLNFPNESHFPILSKAPF